MKKNLWKALLVNVIFALGCIGEVHASDIADATDDNPFDVTDLLASPSFEDVNGNSTAEGWTGADGTIGHGAYEFREKTFDLYQVIEGIPNGTYRIEVSAYERIGASTDDYKTYKAAKDTATTYLYAGSAGNTIETKVARLASGAFLSNDAFGIEGCTKVDSLQNVELGADSLYWVANTMASAVTMFYEYGEYTNVYYVDVTDGTLRIGIKKNESSANDWVMIDNWRLYYHGTSSEYKSANVFYSPENPNILLPYGQKEKESWDGKYYYSLNNSGETPAAEWYAVDFDDSNWKTISGPISNVSRFYYSTPWAAFYATYWVRRHFMVDPLTVGDVFLMHFIHDDICKAYLNGHLVYENNSVVSSTSTILLTEEMVSYLKPGENVFAVMVSDTQGGESFMDFGLYTYKSQDFIYGSLDVEVSIMNDTLHPWVPDPVNQCFVNGNNGTPYSTSTASFSFKSEYITELNLDWASYNYYDHQPLQLFIDGVLKASTSSSSYSTPRLYMEPGEHVITVRDSIAGYSSKSNWSRIKNIRLKEHHSWNDSILTDKSERITFQTGGEYPWTWEDGYAQSSNYGHANTTSKFSTTFTIEEPSKFSFEVCVNSSYYQYNYFGLDINENRYYTYASNSWASNTSSNWMKKSVLLEPGKYTIEYLDSVCSSNTYNQSRLRNVELHSDWLEIDLASVGTLGAEVLYQVDVLGDVELLRVKGTLNAEDWAIIKQMKNLVGLDLTEARFDAVPDYGFDGLSYLSSVKLPEGMTAIGQYAFRGTQIWKIQIPATVTSIGQYAFASTRLEKITFPENSKLTTIGFRAFGNCTSLREFIMPNTVTALKEDSYGDSETFYQCTSLRKLHFSDALTSIPEYTCYECYRLSDIHWPKGLVSIGYQAFRDVDDLCSLEFPETLTSIGGDCFWSNNSLTHVVLPAKLTSLGDNAFIYCEALKYIEFPSYIERYYRTLRGCIALDTIVCHAPTPPAVAEDVLYGGRAKSNVTLIVPAFSAVSYKLDSYWYQYGNIVASEEVQDYWRVAGDLALTNNRRMGGKPDIDLYYNGRLLVGGDAAFEAGTMNFFINESQPCRLLNNCPTVNVDSVNTYYSVNKDTWYFFTPLYDVKVSDVTMSNDASYVFRYYDGAVRASAGTGSSWTDVPKDSVLLAGQGYIFRCNKACVVNIPADASVHAQLFDFAAKSIPLTAHESETEANRNWNYVGNPYPSYYDIWYMNSSAPITVWNESKKTYDAYSVTDDDFVLRPMQSFFVQKPDGEESILFRPEGRQLTNTVAHASYATRSGEPRFVFNLEIGTDSVADRTRVVFNAVKSMDYELECDASKFMSMDATVPQIYSLDAKGNRLAINERPKADGRVALGVYVGKAGEYTLSASRMDGTVKLYDALTDSYTDLAETSYAFRADEAGFIEGRFELTLEVRGGATGIDEAEADEVKVSVKNGIISVSGAEGTAVQLYSIDGKLLQSQTISSGNALFDAPADGVYVVTANGVSQKAVVQEGRR